MEISPTSPEQTRPAVEELFEAFLAAANKPHDEGLQTLRGIHDDLKARNTESIESSLTFISMMETSPISRSQNENGRVWGALASRFALEVRAIDREAGMRTLHRLMRHENPLMRTGCWQEIEKWNQKEKLPYDDYHRLYVIKRLGAIVTY